MWGQQWDTDLRRLFDPLQQLGFTCWGKSFELWGANLANSLQTIAHTRPFKPEPRQFTSCKLWSRNILNPSEADRIWCIYAFLSSCLDESSISGCPVPWSPSRIFLLYFDFSLDFPILMSGAVSAAILDLFHIKRIPHFLPQISSLFQLLLFILWMEVNPLSSP